jgi:hypothetical protein
LQRTRCRENDNFGHYARDFNNSGDSLKLYCTFEIRAEFVFDQRDVGAKSFRCESEFDELSTKYCISRLRRLSSTFLQVKTVNEPVFAPCI